MNRFKYLIGLVMLVVAFGSCEREYDAPPLTEPQYKGADANMTIAQLKAQYTNITDPVAINSDYIIKGYVTANDISGNIYKQLYIQDETGGINLGVDQNSVYTEFRVGQQVYVNLNGLSMVKYGGQLQIGYSNTNANRIPWNVFAYYVTKNGWPSEENVTPKVINLADLEQSMTNTLVMLNNVYFVKGGAESFSESDATTNRTLKDAEGNSIIVRNSNYAKFAADQLPLGMGMLTGILSKFNSTWQFILRSKDDVGVFDGREVSVVDNSSTSGDDKIIFEEAFAAQLGSFSQYSVKGSNTWEGKELNSNKFANMSGYNNGANEDWLISPKMDFAKVTAATVNFTHAIGYQGDMSEEETLWISSDYTSGDPNNATWTQVTINYPPKEPYWTWADVSIEIPENMFGKSSVHIAFRYTCGNSNASTWEVKDFSIQSADGGTVLYPEN